MDTTAPAPSGILTLSTHFIFPSSVTHTDDRTGGGIDRDKERAISDALSRNRVASAIVRLAFGNITQKYIVVPQDPDALISQTKRGVVAGINQALDLFLRTYLKNKDISVVDITSGGFVGIDLRKRHSGICIRLRKPKEELESPEAAELLESFAREASSLPETHHALVVDFGIRKSTYGVVFEPAEVSEGPDAEATVVPNPFNRAAFVGRVLGVDPKGVKVDDAHLFPVPLPPS